MDKPKSNLIQAADHYTSGEYWSKRENSESTYKVDLVASLLEKSSQLIEFGGNIKIAELGCGQGAFAFPLADYLSKKDAHFQISGYDISPQAIDLATGRNTYPVEQLSFVTGSSEDLPSGLDLIFVMDVLEHVENPWEVLRELAGKSKYLVVHLPIEQSIGHLFLRQPSKAYDRYRHIHFFSWETVQLLIKDSPFSIVSYQFTAGSKASLSIQGSYVTKLLRSIRYLFYSLQPELAAIVGGGSVMLLLSSDSKTTISP